MHARRAAERIHLQAGVVCEKIAFHELAVVFGLGGGVFLEGRSVFFWRRDLAGHKADIEVRSRSLKFAQFAGIGCGAVYRQTSKFLCKVTNSSMPFRPSA